MGKLATRSYAASCVGTTTTSGTRMCDLFDAQSLGCTVIGSYSANQIVQEEDIAIRPVGQDIHFNIENIPSGMSVVLNASIPRTDFWLKYPGTDTQMSAQDAYYALLDAMDASPFYDAKFSANYFPQDYTPDEWCESRWCGAAWYSGWDVYEWSYIDTRSWYSFVVIDYNKLYSVSSKFQLTPGYKYLNWTEYMFGQHSPD